MRKRILTGWNFQRGLFLLVGVLVIVQSVVERQWLGIGFGSYFAAMGLFRFGCAAGGCYGGNCQTTSLPKDNEEIKGMDFEDMKQNK